MNINIIRNNKYIFNTLQGTPLQNVSVTINGSTTWSGMTDFQGKVKDVNGNVPELIYGNYDMTASLFGYKTNITPFNVPESTTLTIVMSKFLLTIFEPFDHSEPPTYNTLNFIESFDN